MIDVGGVLRWKFNHTEGIQTRDNIIIKRPVGVLGAKPTDEDIVVFNDEYQTYLIREAKIAELAKTDKLMARGAEDFWEIIKLHTSITDADLPVETRELLNKRRNILSELV